ncbi:lysozyme inhibitor LprI family protein [Thiolinea disciformis]|uniref:lysozyme inhibitor LprI family protein n=1 Tax=Thiolinea disciformis TaxID=125614 RepID=UPI0003672E28|nr:lysozyme inhibitor LprI family protein [Thiolinea disciformis]
MRYIIPSAVLLFALSQSTQAGTVVDCHEVDTMETDMVEVCVKQTNRDLNDNYDALKKLQKDSPEKLKLLKEMQLAWIKMRDAQCEYEMRNTGSNAALVGLVCEVKLTQQRADDLEKMAQ